MEHLKCFISVLSIIFIVGLLITFPEVLVGVVLSVIFGILISDFIKGISRRER